MPRKPKPSHRFLMRYLRCVQLLILLPACGGSDDVGDADGHHDEGGGDEMATPSGATCPTDRTGLTYDAFGKQFMAAYCTRCHSTTLKTPQQRMQAPLDHDFDVLAGISPVWEHIDSKAAAGPKSTNTAMPPAGDAGPKPSMAERIKLGQWLACEFGQ